MIHMAKKWPEKVLQRSFIKEHSFPNGLYVTVKVLSEKKLNTAAIVNTI